eukprot:m.36046 g.36046  ORF g.36046 m.36046 type:complete len:357 (+) comp9008_c0_seq2:91-1161(+)
MIMLFIGVVATCVSLGQMNAFVQTRIGQGYVNNFPSPQLGDLHKKYSALPESCEVMIEVAASSVNPSDEHPYIAESLLPHVLGSDVAGRVTAVQPSCKELKVGDLVWGDIGANTHTASGAKTKELGGYGQTVVALETQLSKIPKNMSLQEAGSLPKVALTTYKAFVWYAGALNDTLWQRKPTVLILGGSGGTGTTGIQLAKAFGAANIITTTSQENFIYCQMLGATKLIDYHTSNWWDPSVIPASSVDVVYDTVGQSGTGDRAMNVLKTGGYYVTITGQLASHVKQGVKQSMFINSDTNLDSAPLLKNLTTLSEKGFLNMPMIKTYPLSQVKEAFGESSQGHVVGKLVIIPSPRKD